MINIAAGVLLCTISVQAEQDPFRDPPDEPIRVYEEHWEVEILPDRIIYPPYLADPRSPRTGSKIAYPIRRSADNNIKIENNFGTYIPMALWTDPENPDEEAELIFEAGVFSRFDVGESWDMDAADYRFGFLSAYRYKNVVGKFEIYHVTSHLGDEYISRVGRKRDSYHLEEAALGFSWYPEPDVRLYAEAGLAVYAGSATENGRWQVGGEWLGPILTGTLSPFVAFDVQSRNEIDWDVNLVLLAGMTFRGRKGGTGMRLGIEYYRGHDLQTQFKEDREHYLAISLQGEF